MKQSGRKNPCPVCGRTKDADCRWSDDVILCHTGTSMRPSEIITISGQKWAFIHHEAGHSGRAAKFKPHRERNFNRTPTTTQELLSRQSKRHQWALAIQEFHSTFQAAWNAPALYTANPQQLTEAFTAITNAQDCGAALKTHLQAIWREHKDLEQLHRLRVEQQLRSIAFMAEDLRQFQQNDLGVPCPAAVHQLLGEELR